MNVDANAVAVIETALTDNGAAVTFNQTGAGGVVLAGANTFTNPNTNFVVNGGSLGVVNQNLNSGPLCSAAVTLDNATLVLVNSSTTATTFNLTNSNPVTFLGASNAIVAGSPIGGAANGSVLVTGSNGLVIGSNQTLTLGAFNGYTLTTGVISGSGTLGVIGTPTLATINTYTGGTNLSNGGMFQVNNAQAFGTGPLNFNGGGFNVISAPGAAIANAWNIAAGSSGTITAASPVVVAGVGTLPIGAEALTTSGPVTLASQISGNGSLTVNTVGSNALVINNAANNFTGGVTLSSGSIDVMGVSSVGNVTSGPLGTGTFTLGSGAGVLNSGNVPATLANSLYFNGNASFGSVAGLTFSGPATLITQSNFSLGANSSIVFSGPIGGAGLNVSGAAGSTLTLTAANSYTGNTSISFGTLIAGDNVPASYASPFGNASTAITIGDATSGTNPAALYVNGPVANGYGVEFDRPITVNANAGPTTIGDLAADAALVISGGNSLSNPNSGMLGAAFTGLITVGRNVNLSAANNGSMTFGAYNPLSGAQGSITGAGGITAASAGNGNVSLINANSYLGATVVQSGQLTLDYSWGSVTSGIVPTSSPVTLSGGTLNLIGNGGAAVNENFVSTTISGFGSVVTAAFYGNPVNVNLNQITRTGGLLDLPLNSGATFTTANANNAGNILGGYLTVNGTDWAVNSAGSGLGAIGALASYNVDNYTQPTNNVDVQTGGVLAISQATTVNTLRFNQAALTNQASIDLNGQTLTLASGGVLVTGNVTTSQSIINGSLTAGGGASNPGNDIAVIQNSAQPFAINANIVDNGFSVGLTKGGSGLLILGGQNSNSGPTTVSAGTLQGSVAAGNFGNTPSIAVNYGANVVFAENNATPFTSAINLTGPGMVTKTGSGTLTNQGSLATGSVTVAQGTFNVATSANVQGPVIIANGATLAFVPTPGLTAQYYGPNFPGFNQIGTTSLAAFNASLTPSTLAFTDNVTQDVLNGRAGNFDFDGTGEGAQFPGQFGYNAPLYAGGNVPGAQVNNWFARYTGYFFAATTGTYTFGLNSDDNSRLWVGSSDQPVVTDGGNNNGQGWSGAHGNMQVTGQVTLTGGQYYPITIGYAEGGGGFGLEAFYAPPGTNIANGDFLPLSVLASLGNSSIGDLSGQGTLTVSGTLTENASLAGSTFQGPITGMGEFVKSGPGTLTLSYSSSPYSGTVRLGQGVLALTSSSALQNATLDLEPGDAGSLGTSGISALNLGGLMGSNNFAFAGPLTVGNNGVNTIYSGNLSLVTTLSKVGSGSFTLSGVNSISVGTIVSGGSLDAVFAASLPGAVQVGAGASLIVQTGNGINGWSSGQIASLVSGGVWSNGAQLGIDTTSGNSTFSGNIPASGMALAKLGANTLTLTGNNLHSGVTTVAAGALTAASNGALTNSPLSVASGATANFVSGSPTIAGLSGAGSVVLGNAPAGATNLTVNSAVNSTFAGVISEAATGLGSLTKNGVNSLTLAGVNTFTNGTALVGGTLVAANVNALGSGPVTLGNAKLSLAVEGGFSGFSGMQLNNGATLANGVLTLTDLNNGEARSAFTTTAMPVSTSGFTASFVYTCASGPGGADGATFCIQNDPAGAGALGGGGGALGYDTIQNSAAVAFNIYNGHVAPGTQFCYHGADGTNSSTNGDGGPAYISTLPADLTSGDPIQVTLKYNGAAGTLTETLVDQNVPANTFSTTYTGVNYQSLLGGASGFIGFTAGTGGLNSVQEFSNFSFINGGASGTPVYANALSVTAGKSAELNLGTAVTTAAQVGNLTLNAASVLSVTRSNSSTANAAYTITAGALAMAGNATINVANDGSGQGTLAVGALSGNGNLTLGGPGAVSLTSSANGYSGNTALNGGQLVAANGIFSSATGSGVVTLNGGTLASDPNLGGQVGTVVGGSGAHMIAPGGVTYIGILNVAGNLTMNGNTTLDFDVLANSNSSDVLTVNGATTLSGASKVNVDLQALGGQGELLNGALPTGSTYVLANFNGGTTLTSASDFTTTQMPSGYSFVVASGSKPGSYELELYSSGVTPPSPAYYWAGAAQSGLSWSSANWVDSNGNPYSSGNVPGGVGAQAYVGTGFTDQPGMAKPQINLTDGSGNPTTVTLGSLTLDNSSNLSGTGYQISQGTLNMSNNGTAHILVLSASHEISSAVVINGALSIAPSGTGTNGTDPYNTDNGAYPAANTFWPVLKINGVISDASGTTPGAGILSVDGPGVLILANTNTYGGGTNVNAGTLVVENKGAIPMSTSLSVAAGATFIYDPAYETDAAFPNGPAVTAGTVVAAGTAAAVPEPGTLALLAAGLAAAAAFGWRRRRAAK